MGEHEERIELHLGERGYPACVAELPDAPKTLYVLGAPEALGEASLSIIGSRRASPYGLAIAQMAARLAAESHITVVSGGARGCDQAAGTAALDAGGRHVAVLGTGADVVYPSSARKLIDRVLMSAGCIVSLEPWGAPPQRWAFPKRNRVIAALSSATLVAEAGMPSGTFSTAETADSLGREVLAVPGSIFSPESRGANYLIANGACCIADAEALDMAISRIFGTLRFCRATREGVPVLEGGAAGVLKMLIANPMGIDELSARLEMDCVSCMTLLSALEVDGLVERLIDGRFSPTESALHASARLGHNG